MLSRPMHEEPASPASRVIAEALVGRQGPGEICCRAEAVGLPRQLTDVILVACSAAGRDGRPTPRGPVGAPAR